MLNRRGQTAVEISALLVIVILSLVAMQGFLRSSIMGNWFNSAQQLGDPYNPPGTAGTVTHSITSNNVTYVNSITSGDSLYSLRIDTGDSFEGKIGSLTVNP